MTLKALNVEYGDLHPIREVAHLFGCSPRVLRMKCAAGEISPLHIEYDKSGMARYKIPEAAIRNWRKKHELRAS